MRGLVVKIFICSVLVQIVTHAVWVTMAVVFAPGPPRNMLAQAMPLYAELARSTLKQQGPAGLTAFLDRASANSNMRLMVHYDVGQCSADLATGAMIVAAGDQTFCLTAAPNAPPRLHLGPNGAVMVQLGLSALFSYGLARYLLRPIEVLNIVAEALGRGDLTARAGPRLGRRRDEAGALVRQFDRMADRIALLIRSQQRFIGDVSHEIKSPLARLTMAIGLARRETGGLATARFDRMETEVEVVSALIRELLELSSLQARDVPDLSGFVDLSALVQDVVDDAGFERRDRAADIKLSLPPGPIRLRGELSLIRRAFENVLRNALFYTPPGTAVDIVVAQFGSLVTVLVQDQGPGVPAEALECLFDAFYRVDDARARNTGGAGIGLAICERAVRLHGGMVRAENTVPSGLAVTLELPCEAASLVSI